MTTINQEIEETAMVGLKRLREYLETPSDEKEKPARVGMGAVRAHTSSQSAQIRKMSAAVSAAKLMGLKGDELRPVFAELAGAPLALPLNRETSGAERVEASKNQ